MHSTVAVLISPNADPYLGHLILLISPGLANSGERAEQHRLDVHLIPNEIGNRNDAVNGHVGPTPHRYPLDRRVVEGEWRRSISGHGAGPQSPNSGQYPS